MTRRRDRHGPAAESYFARQGGRRRRAGQKAQVGTVVPLSCEYVSLSQRLCLSRKRWPPSHSEPMRSIFVGPPKTVFYDSVASAVPFARASRTVSF